MAAMTSHANEEYVPKIYFFASVGFAMNVLYFYLSQQKANEIASARKAYEEQKRKDDLSRGFSMSEVLIKEDGKRTKVSRREYDATDKLDIVIKGNTLHHITNHHS
jgi:superfamily II RNA helicase